MINFQQGQDPREGVRTLTAFISDAALADQGKQFALHVVKELISQSCTLYRHELDAIVSEYVRSEECKQYIHTKMREAIDKAIKEEVDEVFRRRST